MTQAQIDAEMRDRNFARTLSDTPHDPTPLFTRVMTAADRCQYCGGPAVNTLAAYRKVAEMGGDVSRDEAWLGQFLVVAALILVAILTLAETL